jgi:hypothetical protein
MQNTSSSIYQNIFTHAGITGKNELLFKPYGSSAMQGGIYTGRVQAGASIWAFNERVNNGGGPRSFSELLDGGNFDRDAYYADFLGNQMAGRPIGVAYTGSTGNAIVGQFVRPHATTQERDPNHPTGQQSGNTGNFFRESELPATNPSRLPYFTDFQDKEFHQISVVQRGRRRLAMIGYQPTFLLDEAASRAILHDITRWIGYDQYTLPAPRIEVQDQGGARLPQPSAVAVRTDSEGIYVVFNLDSDYFTPHMKEREHTLMANVQYGSGTPINGPSRPIPAEGSGQVEIRFAFDQIGIDPTNADLTTITVKGWTNPNPQSLFAVSDTAVAVINLKQLSVSTNRVDGEQVTPNDNLVVTVVDEAGNPVADAQVNITVGGSTIGPFTTDQNGRVEIPFSQIPPGDNVVITIVASKPGYVNSPPINLTVNNGFDEYALPAPRIYTKTNNAETPVVDNNSYILITADSIIVVFDRNQIGPDQGHMNTVAHRLYASLQYGNRSLSERDTVIAANGSGLVRTGWAIAQIGIDPTEADWNSITITAQTRAGQNNLNINSSAEVRRTINLKQLEISTNPGNGGNTTSNDTLVITVTDKENDSPMPNTDVTIIINGDTITTVTDNNGQVKIPGSDLPHGDVTIIIVAEREGYVNSETVEIKITNTYEQLRLPNPTIEFVEQGGRRDYAHNAWVSANISEIIVTFGTFDMPDYMRKVEHSLTASLQYDGRTVTATPVVIPAGVNNSSLFTITFDASQIGINTDTWNAKNIVVTATAVASKSPTPFQDGVATATINLKYLEVETEFTPNSTLPNNGQNRQPNPGTGRTETNSLDTLIINVFDAAPNKRTERPDSVVVSVNGRTHSVLIPDANGNVRLPLVDLDSGNLEIVLVAKKDGFVDSEPKTLSIFNNLDLEPPYIRSALLKYGEFVRPGDPNSARHQDTLVVVFSKPLTIENGDTYLINLWDKDGRKYEAILTQIGRETHDGRETRTFVVTHFRDPLTGETTKEPVLGDSVNINYLAEVRDRFYNYVEENNRKVPLDLGHRPLNVIMHVFNASTADGTVGLLKDRITPLENDPVVDDVFKTGNGTIIVLDPGVGGLDKTEVRRLHAIILDQVGNRVAESDNMGQRENLVGMAKAEMGGREVMVVAWNNKNSSGRDVGAGAYLILINSVWATEGQEDGTSFTARQLIPVPARENDRRR